MHRGLRTDGTAVKATQQSPERCVPLWCPAEERSALLWGSGVGSPRMLAWVKDLSARRAAPQSQLKWMQELFCQKSVSD